MSKFDSIVTNKFLKTVKEYNMLSDVDCVVAGFSGGADSVCLLHLLNKHKAQFGYNLLAVHINHGIRDEEALRDEVFCRAFCDKHSIVFECVSVDCLGEAERNKESVEECGRRLRYEAFNSFASQGSKIATAHNLNDNAETIIFNITRGASVKGLCGIPFVRDNIIRPILDCSRAEIEGFCSENNLSFVNDSTNFGEDYTRNKIRHNVLPVLTQINPRVFESFSALSSNSTDIKDFIQCEVKSLKDAAELGNGKYKKSILKNAHKALQAEFFVATFEQFSGKTLDNKKVNELCRLLNNGGRIQLYNKYFAECKKDYFRFYINDIATSDSVLYIDKLPYSCDFNDFLLNFDNISYNSKFVNQKAYKDMIDLNNVSGRLRIRTRASGDCFTFKNRNVTKSLKKLFNEADIPLELRDKLPVLADDNGVVWVYGFGTVKRCCISKDSNNIICVRGKYNDR